MATVAFQAVGTGQRVATTGNLSWTHTCSTSDSNTVVVVGLVISFSSTGTCTPSVTYGGTAMTGLTPQFVSSATAGYYVGLFYLFNPVTTTNATVAVTMGGTATRTSAMGNSSSYTGVSGISASTTGVNASGTLSSTALVSTTDRMAVCMSSSSAATITAGGTSRYAAGGSVTGLGDFGCLQDKVGASSTTFTATGTSGTNGFCEAQLFAAFTGATSMAVTAAPAADSSVVKGKLETLTWDFTSANAELVAEVGGVNFSLTGGQGVFSVTAGAVGALVATPDSYDLTASYMSLQVVQDPHDTTLDTQTFLQATPTDGSGKYPSWYIGFASVGRAEAYSTDTITLLADRAHVDGDYYRIRESVGTIYWDYSSGGSGWTNLASEVISGWSAASVQPAFSCSGSGGGSPAHNGIFDNFNIAPTFATIAPPRHVYNRAPIIRSSLY